MHEFDVNFDCTDPVVVRKAIRAGRITGETKGLDQTTRKAIWQSYRLT